MLETTHDGSRPNDPREECCTCGRATPYWYTPHDVPLCRRCAAGTKAHEVPTKREWLNGQRRRGEPELPAAWEARRLANQAA